MLWNSVSHVRRHGKEPVPWDTDFIIISRSAVHVLLLELLNGAGGMVSDLQHDREALAKAKLFSICSMAALTSAGHVDLVKVTEYAADIVRPSFGTGFAALGGMRGTAFHRIVQRMSRDVRNDVFAYLDHELGVWVNRLSTLSELMDQLSRKVRGREERLYMYSDINFKNISDCVRFADDEANRTYDNTHVISLPWALHLVGAFLEMLIALRTESALLWEHFQMWKHLCTLTWKRLILNV